jgi:hypothetical protein
MNRAIAATLALMLGVIGAGAARPTEGQEMRDGPGRRVAADEIDKYILEKKVFFLDVREPKELEELGTLEGYYNIPLGELEKRLGELPKDKLILTA